jgi:ribonuclease D
MTIEQITDAAGLDSLLGDARAAGRCALDTEFVWERTYAPVLCLVQIATPDRLAVIDPLQGAPLQPVATLMSDAGVVKAMHAATADLAAFALHFGAPSAAVFDTQLAAGFAGYGGSLSLERMLDASVHVKLKHAEGFTDWTKRPLTQTQVAYAADDVRHLLAAMDALEQRLRQQGRDRWAHEEMQRRYDGALLIQEPDQAWRRVAGRGKLRGEQLSALVEVAAWREREARRRDMPTSWLIRDPTLIELARRRPATPAEASQVRGLQIKRGPQLDELLRVLAGAAGPPPPRAAELSSELRDRVRVVLPLASSVLQAACAEAGIASELVATRDDLESLIRVVAEGGDDHPLLAGWRRELAGERLLRLLQGEIALRVVPGPPHVVGRAG